MYEKSLENLPLSREIEETWPTHVDALMRLVTSGCEIVFNVAGVRFHPSPDNKCPELYEIAFARSKRQIRPIMLEHCFKRSSCRSKKARYLYRSENNFVDVTKQLCKILEFLTSLFWWSNNVLFKSLDTLCSNFYILQRNHFSRVESGFRERMIFCGDSLKCLKIRQIFSLIFL